MEDGVSKKVLESSGSTLVGTGTGGGDLRVCSVASMASPAATSSSSYEAPKPEPSSCAATHSAHSVNAASVNSLMMMDFDYD